MAEQRKIEGLEIVVVDAQCVGTGNCEHHLSGTLYAQARFSDGTRFSNLFADGFLSSLLMEDVTRFYVAESALGKAPMVVGIVDANDVFHDVDGPTLKRESRKGVWCGGYMTLFGLPLSLFVIGLPILILGLVMLSNGLKLGRVLRASQALKDEHDGVVRQDREMRRQPSILAPKSASA